MTDPRLTPAVLAAVLAASHRPCSPPDRAPEVLRLGLGDVVANLAGLAWGGGRVVEAGALVRYQPGPGPSGCARPVEHWAITAWRTPDGVRWYQAWVKMP